MPRELAVKLTCHDYRLEEEKGTGKKLQYVRAPLAHIRDERFLRLVRLAVILDLKTGDVEQWRRAVESLHGFAAHLPLHGFLVTLALLHGRMVLVEWAVPAKIENIAWDYVVEWAERLAKRYYSVRGRAVPVVNCKGVVGVGDGVLEALMEQYSLVMRRSWSAFKPKFYDILIYAVLDYDPLTPYQRLRRMLQVSMKIISGELGFDIQRSGYVTSRYKRLSSRGLVGRAWAPRLVWNDDTYWWKFYALVSSECAEKAYAAAASSLSSPLLVVGDEYVLAPIQLPAEIRDNVLLYLSDCIENLLVEHVSVNNPLPYHYFDPETEAWMGSPVVDYWWVIGRAAEFVSEEKRRTRRRIG